jgi:hypothetical protein
VWPLAPAGKSPSNASLAGAQTVACTAKPGVFDAGPLEQLLPSQSVVLAPQFGQANGIGAPSAYALRRARPPPDCQKELQALSGSV